MTPEELTTILEKHRLWWNDEDWAALINSRAPGALAGIDGGDRS